MALVKGNVADAGNGDLGDSGDLPFDLDDQDDSPLEGEVVEQETQAEANPAVSSTTQMTAAHAHSGGMTTAASSGQVADSLAAEGFNGLEFGFGSFPTVSLQNDGKFASSDGWAERTEFDCIILSTVEKFIYKNGLAQGDPKEDFFYSYDGITTTSGEPVADKIAEWEANGWTAQKKKYLDAQAQMVGGDCDGELAVLSVPTSSIPRLSGYLATVQMKHGVTPSMAVTRVYCGDKVAKAKFPFYPWAFSFKQFVEE